MPEYEFNYRHSDGSLACKVSAICGDERQAKILAHAMKEREFKTLEVWEGETLVYERPQREHEPDDNRFS